MWSRLGVGWSMARASMGILRRDPKLMLLPLISGSAFALAIGFAVVTLLPQLKSIHDVTGQFWAWLGQGASQILYVVLLLAVLYGFLALTIFCNVALIACAFRSLEGERPSLRAGLATATARLPQILGWALVSSTT